MADGQHGGYRQPSQPAAISGPGALSARTDGGATQAPMLASGGPYGSRSDMADIQGGAPLAAAGQLGGGAPVAPSRDMLTPMDAATERPTEDLRAGMGAMQGMGASQIDDATREKLVNALPTLVWLASQPKASEQTKQFVRQLRGDM